MKQSLILSFFLLYFFSVNLTAQNCGTEGTPMPADLQHDFMPFIQNVAQGEVSTRTSHELPLKIHIIRTSAGTGGLSVNDLQDGIDLLNQHFAVADIFFYQCGSINYIDDSNYYTFDTGEAIEVDNLYNDDEAINIYFAGEVKNSDGENIGGFSAFPWYTTYHLNVIKNDGATSSTFAHEIGHFLGLYHTHTTVNGAEYANGSNCSSLGDLHCDTPADPKLSGLVNSNCQYTGNETDALGQSYDPDVTNIMSYSRRSCRTNFTNSQIAMMEYFINSSYDYLTCNDPGQDVEMTLLAPINLTPNPIICDEPFSVHTDVWNTSSSTFYGDFSAAIFDADDDYEFIAHIEILTESNGLASNYHYTNGLTFTYDGDALDPGNYYIKVYAFPENGTEWIPALDGDFENGIHVEVSCDGTTPIIENELPQFSVKCFPNPAVNFVNWEINSSEIETVTLEIYSTDGKQVHREQQNGNEIIQVNIQNWNAGIYFYRVIVGDEVRSGKLKVK